MKLFTPLKRFVHSLNVGPVVHVITFCCLTLGFSSFAQPCSAPFAVNTIVEVYEGCQIGYFQFDRTDTADLSEPIVVNIELLNISTATAGTDFEVLPNSITIPVGAMSYIWDVTTYDDGVEDGPETIAISASSDFCESSITLKLHINEISPISLDVSGDEYCGPSSIELYPDASGGAPPLSYAWSNGSTEEEFYDYVETTTTYTLTVTDGCGKTAVTTVEVVINPFPTVALSIINEVYLDDVDFALNGIPNGGVFSGPGVIGSIFDIGLAGEGTHAINYIYTDDNSCSASTASTITVLPIFEPFVTEWKTDNPGKSNNTSIRIPIFNNETYDYDVDWNNDGVYDEFGITTGVTHDFGIAGTYTIRIRGEFPRIFFNNKGDKKKIISVNQWGDVAWTSMNKAFMGASKLLTVDSESPDLSQVTNMRKMFVRAASFNSNLNGWDVSNVKNMRDMFVRATSFNSNLNSWDVSNVTNMRKMFNRATSFNRDLGAWNIEKITNMKHMLSRSGMDQNNYDSTLTGWANSTIPTGIKLGAKNLSYCLSQNDRNYLKNTKGWKIKGDYLACHNQSNIGGPPSTKLATMDTAEKELLSNQKIDSSTDIIKVYPNPATDVVLVEIQSAKEMDIKLVLVNAYGQQLEMRKAHLLNGKQTFSFDISILPNGLYLIRVVGASLDTVVKFTKLNLERRNN